MNVFRHEIHHVTEASAGRDDSINECSTSLGTSASHVHHESCPRRRALCVVGGMGGAALNTSPAATGRECHPGAEARTTQDIGRLSPHDDSGLTWPIPCGIRDSTAQRLAVVAVASLAPLIFHNLEEFSFSAQKEEEEEEFSFWK